MRKFTLLLISLNFFFGCAGDQVSKQDSKGEYGYSLDSDVMVPMRDGINLATDIYFPTKNNQRLSGKLPAILVRTPYNKQRGNVVSNAAVYFTSHGYVTVYQDTRGRYNSEGIWHMLDDDGKDGYDTGEWLIDQSWSNGKYGMYGTSYVGGTQHAMALENSPGLTTIIPVDAMSNHGYYSIRYDLTLIHI